MLFDARGGVRIWTRTNIRFQAEFIISATDSDIIHKPRWVGFLHSSTLFLYEGCASENLYFWSRAEYQTASLSEGKLR